MKQIICLTLGILISSSIIAQQGKDGVGNISVANTIVNTVNTTLTSNAAAGTNTISVVSTTGLTAGDLLFIMQAQGALVNDSTNDFGNHNNALPNDTSTGKIHKYNGAGNTEFAEINSIQGNVITLNCTLSDSFRGTSVVGDITTQIVRVQRYTSLTLSGVGSITCNTWNGSTGGVVVIEVQGNTTLAAGTSINAVGKGFRGGSPTWATGFGATNTGSNYGSPSANNGGHKGESIVGDTNQYKKQSAVGSVGTNFNNATYWWNSTPLASCKGNVANGGGGGDAMNCGGGGGSNGGVIAQWNGMGNPDITTSSTYSTAWGLEPTTSTTGSVKPTSSSGGGRGGYAFSAHSTPVYATADPLTSGPSAFTGTVSAWAGDNRHNDGGWGGIPLDYSNGKIYLGGGGGAGDGNDGHAGAGGNGGGLVYLISYGTISGGGQIIADGASALSTANFGSGSPNSNGDDGAGGGGGGGTVIIKSVGTISLTATTPISAQGGKGGDQSNKLINSNAYGPGGGGGGGYISTSNVIAGTNVNAGSNGLVTGNTTSSIKTKFPPNGATSGGIGGMAPINAPFYLTANNPTVCTSSAVSLSVTVNGIAPTGLAIEWYTVAAGGTPISTSNPYNFTSPGSATTITYYAGTCPGTYRIPVLVTVNSSSPPTVTITATNTLVCSGTTVTLTAGGAQSYTWGANAGNATTATVVVVPTANTTYTLTGANLGACAGTNTASIVVNTTPAPTITITPTSPTLCSGVKDTLYATASSALTFTWSANASSATTASVIVSPNTGTNTYTVTGTDGNCIVTQTTSINVLAVPSVSVSPTNTIICNGSSATFTASGATTGYSWSTGANTATVSVSPTSGTNTYTVTGKNGTCTDTKTVSVTVDAGISSIDTTITKTNCSPASGAIAINSITGGTSPYQADINSGTFSTISSFPFSFNNLNTGTYTVVVKDVVGCPHTSIIKVDSINGIATPTITPSGTTTFCQGNSVTLSTPTSASSYTWSAISGTIATATTAISVSPTVTTIYTLTIGNIAGCTAMDTITVTVKTNPAPPVTGNTPINECVNAISTINLSPTGILIIHNSAGQLQPLPFKPTTSGTFTAYDSLNGCVSAVKTLTVNINAAPTTAPTVTTPVTYCYGQTTDTLQALPSATGASLIWEDASHNVLPSSPTPSSTGASSTTYYVLQSIGVCFGPIDSVVVNILSNPNVSFTFTPSANVYIGQTVTYTPVQTNTVNTYNWNFDDPTSSSNTSSLMQPTHAYNTGGSYCATLVVTNSNGCHATNSLCLDVLTNITLVIPNVFSPNDDGINDVFSIKATGIVDLSCDIFDRWGLKLYSWNGVNGFWDGTDKTHKAVDGTYFYVVQTTDVKGDSQTNKGFIQLIK